MRWSDHATVQRYAYTHTYIVNADEYDMMSMRNEQSVQHSSVVWSTGGGAEEEEVDAGTIQSRGMRRFQPRTYAMLIRHLMIQCVTMCVYIMLTTLPHPPLIECVESNSIGFRQGDRFLHSAASQYNTSEMSISYTF